MKSLFILLSGYETKSIEVFANVLLELGFGGLIKRNTVSRNIVLRNVSACSSVFGVWNWDFQHSERVWRTSVKIKAKHISLLSF